MLAELLGMAQANVVTRLEIADGTLPRRARSDAGTEILEGTLPAVITAQRGLNEPRYASLKGIMAAKKKTIEEVEGEPAGGPGGRGRPGTAPGPARGPQAGRRRPPPRPRPCWTCCATKPRCCDRLQLDRPTR